MIERLPVWMVILGFTCIQEAGIGVYSSGGMEARKKRDCPNITAARVQGAHCSSTAGI